jgi:hypothetical protein
MITKFNYAFHLLDRIVSSCMTNKVGRLNAFWKHAGFRSDLDPELMTKPVPGPTKIISDPWHWLRAGTIYLSYLLKLTNNICINLCKTFQILVNRTEFERLFRIRPEVPAACGSVSRTLGKCVMISVRGRRSGCLEHQPPDAIPRPLWRRPPWVPR